VLLAALAVPACGALTGSGRTVLTVQPVANEGGHFPVGAIVDIGLPMIHNMTGRYTLKRVRINYVTNGSAGWQYQNIGMTFTDRKLRPGQHPPAGECP
jgi:hypothetical protein